MSIYVAARLQRARRKRAAKRNSLSVLMSFSVTVMVALTVLPTEKRSEPTIDPVAVSAQLETEIIAPSGVQAMLSHSIFEAINQPSIIDEIDYPSAVEIAQSFNQQRFAVLETRTKAQVLKLANDFAVAAISLAQKVNTDKPVAKEIVNFANQPMPKLAALEAIEAIGEIEKSITARDPSLPFPANVPTKLAYARDNAPKTKDLTRPLTQASMIASQKQHWCLATAIYFEARGENYRGQVAVAQVVRNRVKHRAYPNSICSVVFQNQSWKNRCQFSFACDGIPERIKEKKAWKQAEEIATKVINGDIYLAEVANATHYHANYVRPKWAPKLRKLTKIGVHIFYRFKNS